MRRLAAILIALTAIVPVLAADLPFPADYREWVFLSSGLGMTYGPLSTAEHTDNPLFDNVFVKRAAYQAFLKTGRWPGKTMFVLEVRASQSKGSINNGGHFQTDVTGVQAEVKEKGQWTFYRFDPPGTPGKALPKSATCYACHAANGASDNTFVQFYPTLLPVAKAKGTLKQP